MHICEVYIDSAEWTLVQIFFAKGINTLFAYYMITGADNQRSSLFCVKTDVTDLADNVFLIVVQVCCEESQASFGSGWNTTHGRM